MTATPIAADAGARRATTGLAVRQIRLGALLLLAVAAGAPAMVAGTYERVTSDPAALAGLGALAGNAAIRTIFGEPIALDEAGGFTVWRLGTVLGAILAVWAVVATTRVTRGEEDHGRWDVLLAGRLPLRQVLFRHLMVIASVPVVAGAAIMVVLLVFGGSDSAGAVVHGAGVALLGLFAAALAALTAQIFSARTAATGTAIAILGAGLLARMAADGVPALGRLRWLSPFGLLEISSAYDRNRVSPLLVLAAATALLYVAVAVVCGRRDVGGGLLPAAAGRRPPPRAARHGGGFRGPPAARAAGRLVRRDRCLLPGHRG
ncbi:hypothetical protein AB0M54_30835 [Actinoplanes sp. NPDC051470]|uniref:hypothetical protein n=1 Tax=Actinoplanes sp. NPDC051470 TaxID=3157224 RepID=UPI003449A3A3